MKALALYDFRPREIRVSDTVHKLMRELARRKRMPIGLLYSKAAALFLDQAENYMGSNLKLIPKPKRGRPKKLVKTPPAS